VFETQAEVEMADAENTIAEGGDTAASGTDAADKAEDSVGGDVNAEAEPAAIPTSAEVGDVLSALGGSGESGEAAAEAVEPAGSEAPAGDTAGSSEGQEAEGGRVVVKQEATEAKEKDEAAAAPVEVKAEPGDAGSGTTLPGGDEAVFAPDSAAEPSVAQVSAVHLEPPRRAS